MTIPTREMSLIEKDRALHEQFKAAAEELRSCLNELCDEIIPAMEGDSSSALFFEPGIPTFVTPLYNLADDESDFTECAASAVAAFNEMKEAHDAMGAIVQELRELRNIKN